MDAANYFNEELYDALRKRIGGDFIEETGRRVVGAVHSVIVRARNASDKEIISDARLDSDLFAEEIDGSEIASQLEKKLGIRFPLGGDSPVSFRILYKNPGEADYTERTVIDVAEEVYSMAA